MKVETRAVQAQTIGSDARPDIHRADPRYRRRVAVALIVAVLTGSVALLALDAWLDALVIGAENPPNAALSGLRLLFLGIALALTLPLLALALWLHATSRRVRSERRYPPRAARTVSDTPVRSDAAALRMARTLSALAGVCVLFSGALVAWALWFGLSF